MESLERFSKSPVVSLTSSQIHFRVNTERGKTHYYFLFFLHFDQWTYFNKTNLPFPATHKELLTSTSYFHDWIFRLGISCFFFFHFEEKVLSGKPVLKESVWLILMEPREHSFPQLSLKVTLGSISFDAEHLVTVLQTEKSLPLSLLSFGSSCTHTQAHTQTDTHGLELGFMLLVFFNSLSALLCINTLWTTPFNEHFWREKKY